MPHYAHILTLKRLCLQAHLGWYEAERGKKQAVEISLRLYFPEPPACSTTDGADFLDYGALAETVRAWAEAGEFQLVEFMGMEAFRTVRAYLDAQGYENVKLWVELTKSQAPVPGLAGGSSYIHSDLPPGATTVYAAAL